MIDIRDLPEGAQVNEPGFYRMTAEQYHADPCVVPSLSSSIAKLFIDKTPRHAREAHARFCGASIETNAAMDMGSLVGALVLGCGPRFAVLDFEDFRTKDAKAARDAAQAAGKIAILKKTLTEASAIAASIGERLAEGQCPHCFDPVQPNAHAELVAIWHEGDVWFRAMFDWLDFDRREVFDLKTTASNIAPHAVGRKIADMGYEIQQAFYVRGLERLLPETSGRWKFRFVFAETAAPYEVVIAKNDATAREMGRRKVCYAIQKWADCMRADKWPGYPRAVVTAEHPQFAEASWLKREELESEGINYG